MKRETKKAILYTGVGLALALSWLVAASFGLYFLFWTLMGNHV